MAEVEPRQQVPPANRTEEPTTEIEEAPAPAAHRKRWALPKALPEYSNTTGKKSLIEIMEEEKQQEAESKEAQQKELEERLLKEEEAALQQAMQASMAGSSGKHDDIMDEDLRLALQLSMQESQTYNKEDTEVSGAASLPSTAAASLPFASACTVPPTTATSTQVAAANADSGSGLTEAEMAEIEKALQEADAQEIAKYDAASLKLALELQSEEDGKRKAKLSKPTQQGNVRTMNRTDFLREQGKGSNYFHDEDDNYYAHRSGLHDEDDEYDYDDMDDNGATEAGFRINSQNSKPSSWSRTDRHTIRGPNQEIRTKHDVKLQGQSNAYRLEVRADDESGTRAHVGNQAFNAFHRSMQKKTVKGVAAHGTGRATADADKTREGALDGRVRLQIARAVNNGLIENFHGCVKEGKEALVFHADQGGASEGFDVAVKVFKRIQEFKNRGLYIEGDPRYGDGKNFRHAGQRQQVEQWAEKEHRNLVRAYRAKVPVPKPLWQKENVLFLRFLGEDGWPSPQLREVDIKKGSKKWSALYEQTMVAIQRLYCDARLVHGDLSEYNILVCPGKFLKRVDEELNSFGNLYHANLEAGATSNIESYAKPTRSNKKNDEEDSKPSGSTPAADDTTKNKDEISDDSLQIVLIDFGQSVDLRHPEAEELLRRDVLRIKQFFDKMAIATISVEAAMTYVQTKDAQLKIE